MRKLEEILDPEVQDINLDEIFPDKINTQPVNVPHETIVDEVADTNSVDVVPEEPDTQIPSRMYTDSEVVGYPDIQMQIDTYNLALKGRLPLSGAVSVLEAGAKRGDVARYIKETLPTLDLTYTGIEANDLLVTVGNDIFATENVPGKLIHGDFLNTEVDQKYDLGLVVSNLIYSPAVSENTKWVYLEQLFRKLISTCNERIVLVLLHTNGGDDSYISYPLPNMVEMLTKYNFAFEVDFGRLADMYTINIDLQNKRYIF